jgi:hypothetical protein
LLQYPKARGDTQEILKLPLGAAKMRDRFRVHANFITKHGGRENHSSSAGKQDWPAGNFFFFWVSKVYLALPI